MLTVLLDYFGELVLLECATLGRDYGLEDELEAVEDLFEGWLLVVVGGSPLEGHRPRRLKCLLLIILFLITLLLRVTLRLQRHYALLLITLQMRLYDPVIVGRRCDPELVLGVLAPLDLHFLEIYDHIECLENHLLLVQALTLKLAHFFI